MSANRSGREPGATLKARVVGADGIGARDHLALSKDEQNTAAALIFALLPWPRLIGWASFRGGKRLAAASRFVAFLQHAKDFYAPSYALRYSDTFIRLATRAKIARAPWRTGNA
jgi:hypothetical protein